MFGSMSPGKSIEMQMCQGQYQGQGVAALTSDDDEVECGHIEQNVTDQEHSKNGQKDK